MPSEKGHNLQVAQNRNPTSVGPPKHWWQWPGFAFRYLLVWLVVRLWWLIVVPLMVLDAVLTADREETLSREGTDRGRRKSP